MRTPHLENYDEETATESLSSTKVYFVTFNKNRSFELFIGRKVYFFGPYETKELSEEEIEHKDFKQQSGYFNIKGGRE